MSQAASDVTILSLVRVISKDSEKSPHKSSFTFDMKSKTCRGHATELSMTKRVTGPYMDLQCRQL